MRKQFCDALVARAGEKSEMIFLTGDLGFMALEPLQKILKERFINAGVSEQNMVSVAAALAREGLDAWVYSIAPFCYARPFEQIRNDVAFHHLPVKLIGNGGGYGYGVMGPTHHAIEDYGIMLALSGMKVFVPTFDEDVAEVVYRAGLNHSPCYVRLGRGEPPSEYSVPFYAPWRQLVKGSGWTVVAAGPIAGTYLQAFAELDEGLRPNFWVVTELPFTDNPPPELLIQQIGEGPGLCVIEEHVQRGSMGSELALYLLSAGIKLGAFEHFFAKSHHYDRYGSQAFLRKKSNLDSVSVLAKIADTPRVHPRESN